MGSFQARFAPNDGLDYLRSGEVAEWLKAPLSKSGSPERRRGFKSHPLRHSTLKLRLANHAPCKL